MLWPHWIMAFLFYQTGFIKILWSSILINAPLFYLALKRNFKQISYLTTLVLGTVKKKKCWEPLIMTNVISSRMLLALPKRPSQSTKICTFLSPSFVKSQYNNSPLIWMFCSKKALHKLNNIHERSLRLIHQDYVSNFVKFLVSAKKIKKCLEFLMIEGYKYVMV